MEQVPRYTSYPTAPHFHKGVNSNHCKHLLNELDQKDNLSLYFHIPFCRQLCWFCGCHTKIVNGYRPIGQYLEMLQKEVQMVASTSNAKTVKHIHFGGGSPTVIEAQDFLTFMQVVKNSFQIEQDAEIAIEIDPRTVNREKVAAYAKSGVNRASLGVQDFDEKVQKAINRIQTLKTVRTVVEELRNAAIKDINLDLIYGLPYQTLKTIETTIDHAISLDPNRISLFGYAHVPWMKKHQELVPTEALPGQQLRMEMFNFACETLQERGYVSIGLDHFVKPDDPMAIAQNEGTLQRNFQGYTTDQAGALIGMGVSSISTYPNAYAQNHPDYRSYVKAIEKGELPIAKGVILTSDDVERRAIIMSLMCGLKTKVCADQYASELERLVPYLKSGALTYDEGQLIVNEGAHHSLRKIASTFDSYLTSSQHSYSQAV